ncbi:MAG: hypothetical protein K2H76_03835, partial [Muribaculaceae bacterium]|nr:hypothetical protein [Muribaculaceae bacterium]
MDLSSNSVFKQVYHELRDRHPFLVSALPEVPYHGRGKRQGDGFPGQDPYRGSAGVVALSAAAYPSHPRASFLSVSGCSSFPVSAFS